MLRVYENRGLRGLFVLERNELTED